MLFRPISRYGSAPLLILPGSRCSSANAFYTALFLLRQRPRFLYCPLLVAAAPALFILFNSRCGSAPAFYTAHFSLRQRPAFYTAHFSLRQRPRFSYSPILAAAAPPLFILPISRCGSAPLFILPGFCCGSAHAFYTYQFSLRQRPLFLYRSEEHTSELQSPVPISYAVFCLKKKNPIPFISLLLLSHRL